MKKRFLFLSLFLSIFISCKENPKKEENKITENATATVEPFFKISLAQWSLHKPIMEGSMNPLDFAQKANEMGFDGIEYVSQLYTKELEKTKDQKVAMDTLVKALKAKSEQYNIKNVLIMVDNEGDLAATDINIRDKAVENHKKWVDAAAVLGCHSIRVNLNGAKEEQEWKNASVDGLTKLSDYASKKNINVIVENHGGFSSNAVLLMDVINNVDRDNCGTLPDFGNFCMERSADGCAKEYPRYEGIEQMMPKAKGVSAKTYTFNDAGEETSMDYTKILQIVKDAGYTGYIDIEYEGEGLSPEEGIMATKQLLLTTSQKLN